MGLPQPSGWSSSRRGRRLAGLFQPLLFIRAGAPEYSCKAIIPFVAGVLIHAALTRNHGDFPLPGFGECRRIIHRELVEKDVGSNSGKALDQMEIFVRSSKLALAREIRTINDQCIGFPVAARIAHPLTDCMRKVWPAIQRDEAGFVEDLRENYHVAGYLDNLIVRRKRTILMVVVKTRKHRGSSHRKHNAPLIQRSVFRTVGWMFFRVGPV